MTKSLSFALDGAGLHKLNGTTFKYLHNDIESLEKNQKELKVYSRKQRVQYYNN